MRRELYERYGEKKLYEGGLSVRTTLDPKLQVVARKTLTDGARQIRRDAGLSRRRSTRSTSRGDWGLKLADEKALNDIGWRLAVVLDTTDQSARIGFQPAREPGGAVVKERQTGNMTLDGVKWAKAAEGPTRGKLPAKVNQVLNAGDVIYVEPLPVKEGDTPQFRCGRFRKSPARWW